jgi:hypothetical protein
MNWNDHDHRGEYAETSHDHSFWDLHDVAELHHRHYDDESTVQGLREDLSRAEERIRRLEELDELDGALDRIGELEKGLHGALERIRALEADTPQARQLQLEADLAAADLAESGYDRHGRGCGCSYCYDDEDEVTP